MNRWPTLKNSVADFRKEWGVFINLAVLGVTVLYLANVSLSLIGVFLIALFLARVLTYDILSKWTKENLSPGTEGGLSPIYPRVWTFELHLTKTFLQEITAKVSGKTDHLLAHAFRNEEEFLQKLVIDEYINRLRVHRWLVSASNGARYDWFDIDKSSGRCWNFDKNEGCCIWNYASKEMTEAELTLSCSWERDVTTKRPYLQLVLWIRHWEKSDASVPSNVIFKVPLEPGRLCDERGQTVYVRGQGGREFKAGDLEMFPYNEDNWDSGKDNESRLSWYLGMKTYHDYL
jgi:hypothetical protein